MNKLYIVRHGKTDWNVKHILQGSNDIPLNKIGIKEAKKVATLPCLRNIDVCISSPLIRAKKTAEILTGGKIKIIYDDLLKERGFGSLEGKKIKFDLIEKHWNYALNYSSYGIETIRDCLKRASIFLDKIKDNYDNKNILIVTHGGFLKALHYNIIGYDDKTDFLSFNPENTKIYEYYY